jgi:hypothetical protein
MLSSGFTLSFDVIGFTRGRSVVAYPPFSHAPVQEYKLPSTQIAEPVVIYKPSWWASNLYEYVSPQEITLFIRNAAQAVLRK